MDIPNNSIIKLSGNLIKDSNLLKKRLKNNTEIKKMGKNEQTKTNKYK